MRKYLTVAVLLIKFSLLYSQQVKVISDFRLHTRAGISKKIFHKWGLEFENSLKFEKDASRIDEYNADLSLSYKPYKFIGFKTGYRFNVHHKNSDRYDLRRRINTDMTLKYEAGRYLFNYRIRYQNSDDDYFQYDFEYPAVNVLRNRLLAEYDIRKSHVTPSLGIELFGQCARFTSFAYKIRPSIGIECKLIRQCDIELRYYCDRELNNKHPYLYSTVDFGVKYAL